MNIFCDEACEDTGSDPFGGTWCDFLGKDGCRACDIFECVKMEGGRGVVMPALQFFVVFRAC